MKFVFSPLWAFFIRLLDFQSSPPPPQPLARTRGLQCIICEIAASAVNVCSEFNICMLMQFSISENSTTSSPSPNFCFSYHIHRASPHTTPPASPHFFFCTPCKFFCNILRHKPPEKNKLPKRSFEGKRKKIMVIDSWGDFWFICWIFPPENFGRWSTWNREYCRCLEGPFFCKFLGKAKKKSQALLVIHKWLGKFWFILFQFELLDN